MKTINQGFIRQSAVYLMHFLCRSIPGAFENSGFRLIDVHNSVIFFSEEENFFRRGSILSRWEILREMGAKNRQMTFTGKTSMILSVISNQIRISMKK